MVYAFERLLLEPFWAGLEGDHCGDVGLYAGDAGAENAT